MNVSGAHETYALFEIPVPCVSDVLGVTGRVEIKVVFFILFKGFSLIYCISLSSLDGGRE